MYSKTLIFKTKLAQITKDSIDELAMKNGVKLFIFNLDFLWNF